MKTIRTNKEYKLKENERKKFKYNENPIKQKIKMKEIMKQKRTNQEYKLKENEKKKKVNAELTPTMHTNKNKT